MSLVVHRDFETCGALNLPRVGVHRYVADPLTGVRCVAYAVNHEPVQLWLPGDAVPTAFIEAAHNPDWNVVAHNDEFESAIEHYILVPRYGFPEIPIERRRCTMVAARALALPAELALLAKVLCLKHQKDPDSKRVMLRMSKPRKPRADEDPSGVYFDNDPEGLAQLYERARLDVEIERELYDLLSPLSAEEQVLWAFHSKVNARGFCADLELAKAARELVRHEQAAINAEIATLTNGEISTAGQVAKIAEFVRERGHQLAALTKRSVSAVLAHGNSDDDVHRLLELRREGARASVRKLDALFASVSDDNRLRDTLRFHGAAPGRWSGRGFQPQNLKRAESEDIAGAVDAVLAGDLDGVRKLGPPLSVIGDVMRAIVCAPPGYDLIAGDFSAIESRVLAWLANETWKLDNYREFDRTGDPKLEPYCVTASRILGRIVTPDDEVRRQLGKTADLALGFGGGLGAWRRFDPDSTRNDEEINELVQRWRRAHPATTWFWRRLESAIKRAIRTSERGVFGSFAFEFEHETLRIVLPSGRRIYYPQARLVPGKFKDTTRVAFKDNARGDWTDADAWHGTFAENVVQAVARDLLAAAMLRIEHRYPVVLHVHDEVVCEVPKDFGDVDQFHQLMIELPGWAEGLPVAAKVRVGERYSKIKTKPQNETPATTNGGEDAEYPDDF